MYSTVAFVPLAVKVVVPVPAPMVEIGVAPAMLSLPFCDPVARVTLPIGLVLGATAPGKLYTTLPPTEVLPEDRAKVALFWRLPVALVVLTIFRSLAMLRFDTVEVRVVPVPPEMIGFRAIKIPPLLSLVNKVAVPFPVEPALALVAQAAPTVEVVDD